MRTKAAVTILLLALAILHLIVILAGFIAPYGPSVQNRELPYAPPTRLHFVDASGFHLRPFVYASALVLDSYEEDRTREYPVHLFVMEIGQAGSKLHAIWRVSSPPCRFR